MMINGNSRFPWSLVMSWQLNKYVRRTRHSHHTSTDHTSYQTLIVERRVYLVTQSLCFRYVYWIFIVFFCFIIIMPLPKLIKRLRTIMHEAKSPKVVIIIIEKISIKPSFSICLYLSSLLSDRYSPFFCLYHHYASSQV